MPTLPLPPLGRGIVLDTGDLTVSDIDDVAAEWDDDIQDVDNAPIRDAIEEGQHALIHEYQRRSRYAAAQSDPLRATGEYQDEIFSYERGIHRQANEDDVSYRARGNAFQLTVDPNDIVAAVNAILAPYTSIAARYFEHSDGIFLPDDTTSTWSCHLYDGAGFQPPNYPDRLYDAIPNRRPGGARMFDDAYGRIFVLEVPDLAPLDANITGLFDGNETDPNDGVFLGEGSTLTDQNVSYLWDIGSNSFDIYTAIVNSVEAIRAQSIRWVLFVEPQLTS